MSNAIKNIEASKNPKKPIKARFYCVGKNRYGRQGSGAIGI